MRLLLLLFPFFTYAQSNIKVIPNNPWLFTHIEQTLYLESCGLPLSELSVYSRQKKLPLEANGSFQVKPLSGRFSVQVYHHQGQDSTLLNTFQFSVKQLPQPLAFLSIINKNSMSRGEFLAQRGIGVELINYDYNVRFPVEKFTLLIVKEGKMLYFQEHLGGRFSPALRQELASILKGGEQILISNIQFRSPYHHHKVANSIALTLETP